MMFNNIQRSYSLFRLLHQLITTNGKLREEKTLHDEIFEGKKTNIKGKRGHQWRGNSIETHNYYTFTMFYQFIIQKEFPLKLDSKMDA